MAKDRIQRRLAAILAADVVGYSRLMERDEASTLTELKVAELPQSRGERTFRFLRSRTEIDRGCVETG